MEAQPSFCFKSGDGKPEAYCSVRRRSHKCIISRPSTNLRQNSRNKVLAFLNRANHVNPVCLFNSRSSPVAPESSIRGDRIFRYLLFAMNHRASDSSGDNPDHKPYPDLRSPVRRHRLSPLPCARCNTVHRSRTPAPPEYSAHFHTFATPDHQDTTLALQYRDKSERSEHRACELIPTNLHN